jgi:hypothetical protein
MSEGEQMASEETSSEVEALEKRLAEAQLCETAADRRLEPTPLEALRARVDAAEKAARNKTALAAAVAKYGAIGVHVGVAEVPDGRLVIVRRPHPVAFKAFQDLERVTVEETEKLVRPCVVFPELPEYDRIADEFPGVVSTVAVRVSALAGVRKAELRGK